MFFQELILTLQRYWHEQGCLLTQPYDVEKGAGTFNTATFLRALGPEPFAAAYAEPCRRPTDGRYGENPIRMQHYYQFQVVMKPSPPDIVERYLGSLRAIGIHPEDHDLRLVHDDWESPTLGAWGLGWEVWADGMEITQFTYFQQVGGIELRPVMGEITYGLERLCMFIQKVDNVFDVAYNERYTYGDLFHENEVQFSRHNFEQADIDLHVELFRRYEGECRRLCDCGSPLPASDYCLKASHSFNTLDARGAISVSERQNYILRVRQLARAVAEAWLANRESLGYPLLKGRAGPAVETDVEQPVSPEPPEDLPARAPLLLELGTEEMPARVFRPLFAQLPALFDKHFGDLGLAPEDVRFFATPRRLTVSVGSVSTRQPDRVEVKKGPPLRIARDADGKWTKAALGFAARNGVEPDDLAVRDVDGTEYLFAEVRTSGRPAPAVLAEAIPAFFAAIHWYKTMRWSDGDCAFVRPVHWLVALLGEQVVPCSFAGTAADRLSRGHRFLAPEAFPISAERTAYLERLRQAGVIADHDEREGMIRQGVEALAAEQGLRWRQDDALLHEINFLVECPVPVLCSFAERYLQIPEAVLVSEMRGHQRYLALDTAAGKLSHQFVAISNMRCRDQDLVRQGYEKVLRSRFADAEFFLEEDLKTPLVERVEKLDLMVFQARLGSYREKVERIRRLAAYLVEQLGLDGQTAKTVDRIALLCKTDLSSLMVGEFPELQGEIGAYYALTQGLPPAVAAGIREHYLPRGARDALPEASASALVGVADRIDTLTGIFAIGKPPTGSADPFALRRACLGAIALIVRHGFHLDLIALVEHSLHLYGDVLDGLAPRDVASDVADFVLGRVKVLLHDEARPGLPGGFAWDTIDAVVQATTPWSDVTDLVQRLQAMDVVRQREDFGEVAATFKRANNILRGIELPEGRQTDPARFEHPEEGALHQAVANTEAEMAACLAERRYAEALATVVPLRATVDAFFEAVLVNAPDAELRVNRQLLVAQVVKLVLRVADFSAIQG